MDVIDLVLWVIFVFYAWEYVYVFVALAVCCQYDVVVFSLFSSFKSDGTRDLD